MAMTPPDLDEAVRLAREVAGNPMTTTTDGAERIACALLALEPLYRAAKAWRDTEHLGARGEFLDAAIVQACEIELVMAVDAIATARRGGGA